MLSASWEPSFTSIQLPELHISEKHSRVEAIPQPPYDLLERLLFNL